MSVVAAAVIGSTVVGGVTASRAGRAEAEGQRRGIEAEERIAERNIEFQRELAETQREDFAPWRQVGEQALNRLWRGVQAGDYEIGAVDVTRDPGYQFRLSEGIEALDKSAAARGRLQSGAHSRGVTRYAQNVASDEYARAYARESDNVARRFNILSSLSSGGQASAAGQAQSTAQLAQTGGNILSNLGRAQNIGQQNIGAARAGAYRGISQSAQQGIENAFTAEIFG